MSSLIHFGCWNKGFCKPDEVSNGMSAVIKELLNFDIPSFYLIAGDNYYPDKIKGINGKKKKVFNEENFTSGFECIKMLKMRAPVYMLMGNHDLQEEKDMTIAGTEEQADKCALLMHTPALDPNGTDLHAVKRALCPDYNIIFSQKHISTQEMAFMYNISDVTINIASNEGFGLSGAESIMCETPILNNITGGLQDHCGFKLKGEYLTADDYIEIGSLHDDRKWKNNPDLTWGDWVIPVWPSNRSIQGSPETPFIFDDRARFDDVAEKIKEWYDTPSIQRKDFGLQGREFVTGKQSMLSAKEMCKGFVRGINSTLKNWKPRKRFSLYKR